MLSDVSIFGWSFVVEWEALSKILGLGICDFSTFLYVLQILWEVDHPSLPRLQALWSSMIILQDRQSCGFSVRGRLNGIYG